MEYHEGNLKMLDSTQETAARNAVVEGAMDFGDSAI
jgi:hypothetical protein